MPCSRNPFLQVAARLKCSLATPEVRYAGLRAGVFAYELDSHRSADATKPAVVNGRLILGFQLDYGGGLSVADASAPFSVSLIGSTTSRQVPRRRFCDLGLASCSARLFALNERMRSRL